MKEKKHTKLGVYAIFVSLLFLCTFMTGCNNNIFGESESSGFTDFEHIEQEFLQTVEELNWPESATIPTELKGETADSFQVGYGNTRASMMWECAWEKEWLETYTSDPERAEKALEELEKAPEMPYMSPQKCDDATREYFADNLEKAKLGDPSGFEENIRLNCPE